MRGAWIVVFALGCAESATQKPLSFNNRDLGDHLQQPGDDLGGAEDLATVKDLAGVDLAGALPDLAGSPDLAGAPDLAAQPDLATAPDLANVVDDEPPIYVHTSSTLYRLNPFTYDLTLIGSFGIVDEMTDLAERADGKLIGTTRTDLYLVNATNGSATLLADTLYTDVVALTYLSDGRLMAADITGNVYEINLNLNNFPPLVLLSYGTIGSYGSGQSTAGDLFSVDDLTMWGLTKSGGSASDTNNALMIVNNVNGVGTQKGLTGFGQLWGAVYSHHRILAFSSMGEVVEINPSNGAGTLKRTHAGIVFFGAASNPTVLP
jgi:hypothetical protein